jgi:hypothetical protein
LFPDFWKRRRHPAAARCRLEQLAPSQLPKGKHRIEAKEAAMRFHSLYLAACVFAAAGGPGLAQDSGANPPAQKCQVEPQANSPDQPKNGQTDATASPSLTEKLAPCDGVLKPPAIGDKEMTQPPPATGKMPVIKPRDLPQQQPDSK